MLRDVLKVLKNIALFFLAPFIALGYIIALPVLGMFVAIRLSMDLVQSKIKVRKRERMSEHSTS